MKSPGIDVPQRPSFRRLALGYLLTLIFLFAMGAVLVRHRVRWSDLATADVSWLAVAAVACTVNLVVRAVYLAALTQSAGVFVGAYECCYVTAASQMLSAVTLPGFGVAFRAVYLWRRYGIPFVVYARSMAIFAAVWLGLSGLMGAAAFGWLWRSEDSSFLDLLPTLGMAGFIASMTAGRRERPAGSRQPALPAVAAFVTCFCFATRAIALYSVFRAIAVAALPAGISVMTAAHQLSAVVGLTPGGAGVQEAADLLAAAAAGVSVPEAIAALLILRAVGFLVTLVFGGPSWLFLTFTSAEPASIRLETNSVSDPDAVLLATPIRVPPMGVADDAIL